MSSNSQSERILQKIFESLSGDIWLRIKDSETYHIPQGEESLTDHLLLEILRAQVKSIRLWKCPKTLEMDFGIDWDWVIGSNKVGWRRYAVQAKKLGLPQGKKGERHYGELGHTVKSKEGEIGPSLQNELLKEYARKERALPIYCLYNYAPKFSASKHWQCCSFEAEEQQLGCSVTPANYISYCIEKGARGRRSFSSIHSYPATIPWRCLVCCPNIVKTASTVETTAIETHESDERYRAVNNPFFSKKSSIFNEVYQEADNVHPSIPSSILRWLDDPAQTRVNYLTEEEVRVAPKRIAVIEIDNV
jgi:hypothetical protein